MPATEKLTADTIEEVGIFLGVSARQVSSYLARGCPGSRGNYPLPEILAWVRANVWEREQYRPEREPAGDDCRELCIARSRRTKSLQKLADLGGFDVADVRRWSQTDPTFPRSPDGSISEYAFVLWCLKTGKESES